MLAETVMKEIDFTHDPVEEPIRRLREAGHRIVPVNWNGHTAWVVHQYADVLKGISDEENIPRST